MKLRPLMVLTGTLHVEGGDRTRDTLAREVDGTAVVSPGRRRRASVVYVREKRVSDDRKRANTIVTNFMRVLRQKIVIIRTPFGALLDPQDLKKLHDTLSKFDKRIREFNQEATPTVKVKPVRLTNAVLVERLQGIRRAAVEGWINRQLADGNPAVQQVVRRLSAPDEETGEP